MITIIKNNRINLVLFGLAMLVLITAGCASADNDLPDSNDQDADVEQVFTMDEVAYYDGQEGRPAYIVVDGVVYDVTAVRQWTSGTHFSYEAGTDVTDALRDAAPHGRAMLNSATVVGRIDE